MGRNLLFYKQGQIHTASLPCSLWGLPWWYTANYCHSGMHIVCCAFGSGIHQKDVPRLQVENAGLPGMWYTCQHCTKMPIPSCLQPLNAMHMNNVWVLAITRHQPLHYDICWLGLCQAIVIMTLFSTAEANVLYKITNVFELSDNSFFQFCQYHNTRIALQLLLPYKSRSPIVICFHCYSIQ